MDNDFCKKKKNSYTGTAKYKKLKMPKWGGKGVVVKIADISLKVSIKYITLLEFKKN